MRVTDLRHAAVNMSGKQKAPALAVMAFSAAHTLAFEVNDALLESDGESCKVARVVDEPDSEKPCALEYPDGSKYWASSEGLTRAHDVSPATEVPEKTDAPIEEETTMATKETEEAGLKVTERPAKIDIESMQSDNMMIIPAFLVTRVLARTSNSKNPA